jgi:protein tyrosine phosphatase (PTP) superfamily phosphohydrolase (DUF442 family)
MRSLGILIVAICSVSLAGCRFDEVDEGKFYRSQQLSAKNYEKAIKTYGIKTIINLRGKNTGKDWYDEERAVSEKYGVNHIDIGLSAKRIPHRENLIQILNAYRNAERPILVHCQGGADRSGVASAIYQIEYMGKTNKEARENMLNPSYAHGIFKEMPQGYFIADVYRGEDWARNKYDPCEQEYRFYPHEKYCDSSEFIAVEEEPTF